MAEDHTGSPAADDVSSESSSPGAVPAKSGRIRRKDCTREEWIRHRKLRKKIASAKWYAKKKKSIIQEENNLRRQLEEEYQERRRGFIWSDTERAYWRAVVDHHYRGYPVRPQDLPIEDWIRLSDVTEQGLTRMIHESPWRMQWNDEKCKCFRQMCMRELLECYRNTERPSEQGWSAITARAQSRTIRTSWWDKVSGGWWPFMCTAVGLVFIHLASIGEESRWSDFCAALKQVYTTTQTTRVSHTDTMDPPETIHDPTPTPMRNEYLDHPILHEWIAFWMEQTIPSASIEEVLFETELAPDQVSTPTLLDYLEFFDDTPSNDTLGITGYDQGHWNEEQEA